MKILIATRKDATDDERIAASEARSFLASLPDSEPVIDTELDWAQLRATYGGYKGAYEWVLAEFGALLLVPAPDRTLARGQYTMAENMLAMSKTVSILLDGRGVAVRDVERIPKGNWKRYGRCLT